MCEKLRIAQIVPISERVPPEKYGGTQRVASSLTEELVARGHEVTLFASGDSQTKARLRSIIDKPLREPRDVRTIYNMLNFSLAYSQQNEFDVVHDHTIDLSLPLAQNATIPVVVTLHTGITKDRKKLYQAFPHPTYIPISKAQVREHPDLHFAAPIYNGLNLQESPFGENPDREEFLLFVGRIDAKKGVHLAITAAKEAGMPLKIAAKLDPLPECQAYYETFVKPALDGRQTEWLGEVNEYDRNQLMSKAKAVIHPNTWNEPFGLVVIEAMACGAPVVGANKGALPEIIIDGETGYIVNNLEDMGKALKDIDKINRRRCREHVLVNFSAEQMTDHYEELYYQLQE
ncbi:MAG TPA: glycosyltransferase family 4 protein [Candidatus Saccharimonadales bacterium]|nr:glycosyltransferase family 4 protein [Candidatus Saccharimonadales bacterium]